jgi:hypothetical protein|tara:strand:- start:221 stop:475 length:255 start_codon:yes stop_codon:yes gene_type:complete
MIQTNMKELVVIHDRKAPVYNSTKSGTSKWKDLFESMKIGDWVMVKTKQNHTNIQAAAATYLRGRYRLYMNPEEEGTWVFTKYK